MNRRKFISSTALAAAAPLVLTHFNVFGSNAPSTSVIPAPRTPHIRYDHPTSNNTIKYLIIYLLSSLRIPETLNYF